MSELLNRVRKGLDICCSLFPCNENECPYWNDLQCIRTIKEDALALINAQQERIRELEAPPIHRVLTLDEAKQTTRGMPVIVERLRHGCEYMLCAQTKYVNNGIRMLSHISLGLTLQWPDYNRNWRIWTAFPSLYDRKAVAWDE